MATINATPLLQTSFTPAPNMFPPFLRLTDDYSWNVGDGAGSAVNTIERGFFGGSVYVESTDDDLNLQVNAAAQTRTYAKKTGDHFLQFSVSNPVTGVQSADLCSVFVYKNGTLLNDYYLNVLDLYNSGEDWSTFWAVFHLDEGDYIDLSIGLAANNNYPIGGSHAVYLSGFCLNADDRGADLPSQYQLPSLGLPSLPTSDGDYSLHIDGGVATWTEITP